jgi:hypothetical protein
MSKKSKRRAQEQQEKAPKGIRSERVPGDTPQLGTLVDLREESRPEVFVWFILPVLAIVSLCIVLSIFPIESEDIFSNVVTGRFLWENVAFPEMDPFSYSGPHRWFLNRPLPSILFFAAHSIGGLSAVQVLCALIVAASYATMYVVWAKRTRMPLAAFTTVFVAAYISCYWFQARIYLFSYLFTVLSLICITSASRRLILFTIPLQIVWINTHPSALLGVFFVGAWWIAQTRAAGRIERFSLGVLLAVIASNAINPTGFGSFTKFFDEVFGSHPSRTNILEWLSPFNEMISSSPLVMWFLLVGVLFLRVSYINILHWREIRSAHLLFPISIIFFLMALTSARHIPLFYLIFGCLMICTAEYQWKRGGGDLQRIMRRRYRTITTAVALAAASIIGWVGLYGYSIGSAERRFSFGIQREKFPERPLEILKSARIEGNIFSDYGTGSFFLYTMYPDYKVNIDSARLDEVYGEEGFLHYMKLGNDLSTLKDDIARYDIRAFVMPIPPTESEIVVPYRFLSADPAWRLAYFDDSYLLFVRADEAQARGISTFQYLNPLPLPGLVEILKTKPDGVAVLGSDLQTAERIAPNALLVFVLRIQYELAQGDKEGAARTFERLARFCSERDPTPQCRQKAARYMRLFPMFLSRRR